MVPAESCELKKEAFAGGSTGKRQFSIVEDVDEDVDVDSVRDVVTVTVSVSALKTPMEVADCNTRRATRVSAALAPSDTATSCP